MTINKKFNFTIKDINDLPIPEKGKRVYYYDTKTQGLAICVTSTKKKTFFVYRKIDGELCSNLVYGQNKLGGVFC